MCGLDVRFWCMRGRGGMGGVGGVLRFEDLDVFRES